jgi:hypothetical protein
VLCFNYARKSHRHLSLAARFGQGLAQPSCFASCPPELRDAISPIPRCGVWLWPSGWPHRSTCCRK